MPDDIDKHRGDKGSDEPEDKKSMRRQWKEAIKDVEKLGGWEAFISGVWLYNYIKKSFMNLYERSDPDFFRNKYSSFDDEKIIQKLITVTARKAAILGGIVGAAVTADEIVAIITAGGGGVGLPANVAIAFAAIAGEAVLLTRMQLKLVANIAKLYGVPLDSDDPEDIITIIAFAIGGSMAEVASKAGLELGGKLTKTTIKQTIKKEVLAAIQRVASKLGYKILQRTTIKYAVPVASMGIGSGWNYFSTRAIGKITKKHFIARAKEIRGKE